MLDTEASTMEVNRGEGKPTISGDAILEVVDAFDDADVVATSAECVIVVACDGTESITPNCMS